MKYTKIRKFISMKYTKIRKFGCLSCSSSPKWRQKIQQVLLIFEHEEFLQHGELSPHRSLPAEPEYNHPSFESAAAHQK